ncbi:hypothetical protein N7492_000729 [Penicillium capsulatum]|uniref:RING-type domain-containing protein n=1 Tax=Penicillium capsulatum TaxID=69766 RepID=A0A9W9LZ13_9EURO|nr:hypothetical protein N7492_000729 [Penicillium capsulatum]
MPVVTPGMRARREMATLVASCRVAARLAVDEANGRDTHDTGYTYTVTRTESGDMIPVAQHSNPIMQRGYERVYNEYTDRELIAEYRLQMSWELGHGPELQSRIENIANELIHGIVSPGVEARPQTVLIVHNVFSQARAIEELPRTKLESGMLHTEGRLECSICLMAAEIDDEVIQLRCRHWFHPGCVMEWLKVCPSCPMCRKSVGPS